jgi:hypothetical protein
LRFKAQIATSFTPLGNLCLACRLSLAMQRLKKPSHVTTYPSRSRPSSDAIGNWLNCG